MRQRIRSNPSRRTSRKDQQSLSVHVEEGPNGYWNVSALRYKSDDDSSPDEPYDSEEFEEHADAMRHAEQVAMQYINDQIARGMLAVAVILDDGDSVSVCRAVHKQGEWTPAFIAE